MTKSNFKEFIRFRWKSLLLWIGIGIAIFIALKMGIDQKVVVFSTLVLGLFTQVFSGLSALIVMIPWIGPLLIKVFAIPFFWLLNALGYFVSILAIKKGYTKDVINTRMLTITLLTGIVVGYILGHIIPLR